MADEKSTSVTKPTAPAVASKGQAKLHRAVRPSPTPGGPDESKDFTQEQWRKRDKAEGWVRLDNVTDVPEADEA